MVETGWLSALPYLAATIAMLREAGVIDAMTRSLGPALSKIGFPADLLEAEMFGIGVGIGLPVA